MDWLLAKRRGDVPAYFALAAAMRAMDWMRRYSRRAHFFSRTACALLLAACSENPPVATAPPTAPEPAPIAAQTPEPEPAPVVEEAAPESAPAADTGALERRFFSAQNDPEARIAIIAELAAAPPAAALALMNRLYPTERREDVKMEMLSTLGDLDHTQNRDNQLALCLKALVSGQPVRVRYVAVHLLASLGDPRARAILLPLLSDSEREVRAAAAQGLRDLRE